MRRVILQGYRGARLLPRIVWLRAERAGVDFRAADLSLVHTIRLWGGVEDPSTSVHRAVAAHKDALFLDL